VADFPVRSRDGKQPQDCGEKEHQTSKLTHRPFTSELWLSNSLNRSVVEVGMMPDGNHMAQYDDELRGKAPELENRRPFVFLASRSVTGLR
jgi:hypothetical protein